MTSATCAISTSVAQATATQSGVATNIYGTIYITSDGTSWNWLKVGFGTTAVAATTSPDTGKWNLTEVSTIFIGFGGTASYGGTVIGTAGATIFTVYPYIRSGNIATATITAG